MPDRKSSKQMSFTFSKEHTAQQTEKSPTKHNVTNLQAHKLDLHGRSVLQRVIREGFTKTKT
jgi:hypothetical protein